MKEPRDVCLVIPAYNEEARIGPLLETLTGSAEADLAAAGLRFTEAVIVDDGSTDATASLLQAASVQHERIRPILGRGVNEGKGAAIAAGVAEATAGLVLMADVDLSTPLADAKALAVALDQDEGDVAIGSRDLAGSYVEAPLHRRALGAAFNLAVRALTGLRFADTQCGFKLMPTEVARELTAEQITKGFAFDVELLVRARNAELEVTEVPVTYLHDDRSKVRLLRSSLAMARDLVRIAVRLRLGGRRGRRRLRPEAADRA